MAVYATSDLHGCMKEFKLLLELINFDFNKDTMWIAGDLVNRGFESLEVLRFLYAHQDNFKLVLGNHDIHLLGLATGVRTLKRGDTLGAILTASDKVKLIDWLRRQPLLVTDKKLGFTMTHAGIPPWWSLKKAQREAKMVEDVMNSENWQGFLNLAFGNEPINEKNIKTQADRLRFTINGLTRMRFTKGKSFEFYSKSSVGSAPSGFKPWFNQPMKFIKDTQIIFGHWAALDGKTGVKRVYAMDKGCAWGGSLSAFNLETSKFFKVESTNPNLRIW